MSGEELRTLIFAHIHNRKPSYCDGDRWAEWQDLSCFVKAAYDDVARCLTLSDEEGQ